ncbi:EamA family transporter [Cognaticolwellia mytili]|uniref:EamA family transporter n=1 Tax=Cognaticolwellia mytili TaxID=1888913 RepID=UPI000A16F81D|nr:EamA family transporter [Cognaticolwellia mytili]
MNNRDLLLGIFVMIVWGLNFSVIKLGVSEIDPLLLTALRFTFAVIPAVFFVKRPQVKWRYLVGYGLTFAIGVWGMGSWSIQAGLSAGMASVLMQMNVVISLLVGYFLLKENITSMRIIGSVIAIMGLVLSILVTDGSVTTLGLLLILIASLSWSITSIIVKKAGTKEVFSFSIWGMLFAPLPLFILAFLQGSHQQLPTSDLLMNPSVIFSVLFQAYPVTLFGYWVWNRLLVKYPLSTVAPLSLLVPIFGLLGSAIFYQEKIGTMKAVACILVLTGLMIGLINAKKLKEYLRQSTSAIKLKCKLAK